MGRSPMCPPDEDPIFRILHVDLKGEVVDKGKVGEFIAAQVLRRGVTKSVHNHLQQFVALSGVPEDTVLKHYRFNVRLCGSPEEFNKTNVEVLLDKEELPRAFFCSVSAKPDLFTFLVTVQANQHHIPCAIAVKTWGERVCPGDWIDIINSVDPACFFTKKNGGAFKHERAEWLREWRSNPNLFQSFVRIVVSWSGFHSDIWTVVKQYNEIYGREQPFILLHSDPALLGPQLAKRLALDTSKQGSAKIKLSVDQLKIQSVPLPTESEQDVMETEPPLTTTRGDPQNILLHHNSPDKLSKSFEIVMKLLMIWT